jgi:uncharacterized protein YjbI with pentapeptide repeats
LLATAFSASDEDLLRGRAVTISQIGATLPLTFSFAVAPFVFVFLHVYTLARYDMLAANVRQFLSELRRTVKLEADQERCRQLLTNVEFIQVLVAPRRSRLHSWVWRWLVRGIIVIFPVSVLLLVQINALRYQSVTIISVLRVWLLIDVLMLIWFFYRNPLEGPERRANTLFARMRRWADPLEDRSARFEQTIHRSRPNRSQARGGIWRLTLLSCWLATVASINLLYINVVSADADPEAIRYDPKVRAPLGHYLFDAFVSHNPLDRILCPRLQWGCRYLHVDRRTLVEHVWDDKAIVELWRGNTDKAKALAAIEGLVLRDRSFRFAMLDQSSLFAADLTRADLRGASLNQTSLLNAVLRDAQLQGADLSGTQLQGANLDGAKLQGANLFLAQLQGAKLIGRHLSGVALMSAQLEGASLRGAWLQCAALPYAQLDGANLREAHLQGADLRSAQLKGTDLRGAFLFGAILGQADQAVPTNLALSDLRGIDKKTAPSSDEKKRLRELGQAECLPRFRAWSEDQFRLGSTADGALVDSLAPSYTSSLVKFLADELAATDSAVAYGVVQRVDANLGDDAKLYSPIGCQIIANVRKEKVKVDPQVASELSTHLKRLGVDCKPNGMVSPD